MHISISNFVWSLPFCWHEESLTFSCVGSFDLGMAFGFVSLCSGLNFQADFAKLWAVRRNRWSFPGFRLPFRHLQLLQLPYFCGVYRPSQSIWVVVVIVIIVEHNSSILHFHQPLEWWNHLKDFCSFDQNSEYMCLILSSLQILQRLATLLVYVIRIMTCWRSDRF